MTVRQIILATANYYGRQMSEDVLEMYAEDLADLPPGEVIAAYKAYRRDPKNRAMPLPAQIRELVTPEAFISPEVQAREIAARIVGAITSFGWCNGRAAQEYIGPVGWNAVLRQGGWRNLCENTGVNISPTTLQAQLRDQIEGEIRFGGRAIEAAVLRLPERDSREKRGLTAPSEILKAIAPKPSDTEGA